MKMNDAAGSDSGRQRPSAHRLPIRNWLYYTLLFAVLLCLSGHVYQIGRLNDWLTPLNNICQIAGVVVLVVTLFLLKRQTANAQEDTHLSTIIKAHEVLSNLQAQRTRRFVLTDFDGRYFCGIVRFLHLDERVASNLRGNLQIPPKREALRNELIEKLKDENHGRKYMKEFTDGEVIEIALTAFDILAIPYCQNIKTAEHAVNSWDPVIRKTESRLRLFIEFQRRARRPKEPKYKTHYISMLDRHLKMTHEKRIAEIKEKHAAICEGCSTFFEKIDSSEESPPGPAPQAE